MKKLLTILILLCATAAMGQDIPVTGKDSLVRVSVTVVPRKNPLPDTVKIKGDTVYVPVASPPVHDTVYICPAVNQPPVVSVGADQVVTLPTSVVTLTGAATDADGTIASYQWSKVSGPGGTITSPSSPTTDVTGLVAGTYIYNLAATDNKGASASSTLKVTVNAGNGGYNTLLYSNPFDKASDLNSNQLGSGSISTTVMKSGTGSFKSVVFAGASQISSGWRSEQQYTEAYSRSGDEIAVEYDELFESLPTVQGLSVQWHGNTTGTSGQMSMWIGGAKFQVQRNTIGTAGSPNIYQQPPLMTIQTGRWYHLRWEVRFSSGSDGYVRCYIDGNLYYSVTGKTSDGSGQYLKVGQNLFSQPNSNSIMYIDNLDIRKK